MAEMKLTELVEELGEDAAEEFALAELGMTASYFWHVVGFERGEVEGDTIEEEAPSV